MGRRRAKPSRVVLKKKGRLRQSWRKAREIPPCDSFTSLITLYYNGEDYYTFMYGMAIPNEIIRRRLIDI